MIIRRLSLVNFRNYESTSLNFSPGINVFIGKNAQGKTNLIEAMYYSALARSHRTGMDADIIRLGTDVAKTSTEFSRMGIENRLDFRLGRGRRTEITLGGNQARTRDIIGALNVVLFSPEDLFLIKGAPAGRRRFLDMEISQISRPYFSGLTRYSRTLMQRNALLKKIRERSAPLQSLAPWDDELAPLAADVVSRRLEAVARMSDIACGMQQQITGGREELRIRYEIFPDGEMEKPDASWYNEKLKELRPSDIARGSTGIGPQRDDLIFTVNGANLRSYGSQGQQRTGILSLKLAELEFFRESTGEYPVLLLDDVMSELDIGRRSALLSFIREEGIQTFIAATDEAYFSGMDIGAVYRVEGGKVTRV